MEGDDVSHPVLVLRSGAHHSGLWRRKWRNTPRIVVSVLNIALLGSGFMGSTHASGWRSLEGRARVVSVCSRSAGAAAELAASLGADALGDLEAAIADP